MFYKRRAREREILKAKRKGKRFGGCFVEKASFYARFLQARLAFRWEKFSFIPEAFFLIPDKLSSFSEFGAEFGKLLIR